MSIEQDINLAWPKYSYGIVSARIASAIHPLSQYYKMIATAMNIMMISCMHVFHPLKM